MATLDDECLTRILHFVNCPSLRLCCQQWASHIFSSLLLEPKIRFHKAVRSASQGKLSYYHSTVLDFGGMEECSSFSFTFRSSGHYLLQWFREGLTSDNEQQYGRWLVVAHDILCETLEPTEEPDPAMLRFAEPGRSFRVPVNAALSGHTCADDLVGWERPARGICPGQKLAQSEEEEEQEELQVVTEARSQPQRNVPARENARFIEVDGDMVEVHMDVIENWPEADWTRLMRCRLRFGTGAERWA